MNIKKIRPDAEIKYDFGCDGRDGHYYIRYSCPVCHSEIRWYKSENACDKCGTFYDWGTYEPSIKITRTVKWE